MICPPSFSFEQFMGIVHEKGVVEAERGREEYELLAGWVAA